ncbi:MAG: YfhO family protein [Firmicutes bacterium]|nr:YfhO family protein [Bacillota bacterium]
MTENSLRIKPPGEEKANLKLFLLYTAVFCVFTACIFAVLVLAHRSFIQFHDAYKQGAFRLVELQNQLQNIRSGKGFLFWSWYEGMGMDEPLENFADPCAILGSLLPPRYLELGYTLAALARMYLSGLAFLIMGLEVRLSRRQNLIGAILYVFSACFIGLALRQSEHLVNAYLFPLLVASVDHRYKGKSAIPFILLVAFYMIVAVYFAYMSAIVIVIYIALRYFAYHDRLRPGEYLQTMLRFIGYGLLGMMLSAFTSVFSAFSITRASTGSSLSLSESALLFGKDWYEGLGKMILGTGTTFDYMDIGIPMLSLLLIPVSLRHMNRRSTSTFLTLILFVMLLIPFFCRMFNGFGYETFRWTYMLVLFAVWTGVQQLDPKRLRAGDLVLAALGLALICAWTVGLAFAGEISFDSVGRIYVPLQLLGGLILFLLLLRIRKKDELSRGQTAAILAVTLVCLSAGWSCGFHQNIDDFAKNSTIYNKLNESTVRAGSRIEDDGFYRIDTIDAISRHAEIKFPSNENIWWKTNNLFIYNSRIPQSLVDFNVALGNSYGYARRVFMVSGGNRMGLDFLFGVRYFLGSDSRKPETSDSDRYADYGFSKTEVIDGVNVFRNKYDAGLGFVCNDAMLLSEFQKLDRAEKEQALMEVAVVPDEQAGACEEVDLISANNLPLSVDRIPFTVERQENLRFHEGRIEVDSGGGSLTIRAEEIPDCQLMVSFDHLLRDSADGTDGSGFELMAGDGGITKYVRNDKSRQGVAGLKDFDLSMGHCSGSREITVTFPDKGTYTYDDFYLSAMSTAFYDNCAEQCAENRLKVSEYDNETVRGTVSTDENGILFLSIPAYDNWDVYVDGRKAQRIDDLDITFAGVYVPAGDHKITLKYNNRFVRCGSIVSAIGLILLIIAAAGDLLRRRRRRTSLTPRND